MLNLMAEIEKVAREAEHKVFCEFCTEESYEHCHLCSSPLCPSHTVIVARRSGIVYRCARCNKMVDEIKRGLV